MAEPEGKVYGVRVKSIFTVESFVSPLMRELQEAETHFYVSPRLAILDEQAVVSMDIAVGQDAPDGSSGVLIGARVHTVFVFAVDGLSAEEGAANLIPTNIAHSITEYAYFHVGGQLLEVTRGYSDMPMMLPLRSGDDILAHAPDLTHVDPGESAGTPPAPA
jgi:hypothetical protein